MNTKKIWMLAILFGLVMSVFFLILTSNNNPNQAVDATAVIDEEVQEETEETMEIAEGKRAISIEVTEVQSVSGFVRPGSYVDVVAVFPELGEDEVSAQIILDDMKVLAVGKTFIKANENQDTYQMVTLEVTPAEGTSLAFAKEVAAVVTLMLRGEDDHEESPHVNNSLEQLVKGKMPK